MLLVKSIYKKTLQKTTGKTQAEKYEDSGLTKVKNRGCNLSKYPVAFKLRLLNEWDTNTLLDKDVFHRTMRETAVSLLIKMRWVNSPTVFTIIFFSVF